MGIPFRAVVMQTRAENPYMLVRTKHDEEVKVELEQDEHGQVVVNVRPGAGMAGSVDVEYHTRRGARLLT